MHEITLKKIRDAGPCEAGWVNLLRSLGYTDRYDPDRRVTLGDIAASNGAADALWCARCLPLDDIAVRRDVVRAIMPAVKRASAHTKDVRVHACIDAVERRLGGDDDVDLMTEVESAAWAAESAARAWEAWAAAAAGAAESAAQAVARAAAGEDVAARAAVEALEAEERARQVEDIIAVFGRTYALTIRARTASSRAADSSTIAADDPP